MKVKITSDNFSLIAAKFYNDLAASDQEFQEDLRRIFLIKRLLNQYKRSGELKERLILNHIIIVCNVFGDAAVPLLFHELKSHLPQLTVFLILLNRLPDVVNGTVTTTIPLDQRVVDTLRQSVNA